MKGYFFIPEDELSVSPLTDSEKKWVKRLQRTLEACPERLALITIGDPELDIADISVTEKLDDICDGQAYEHGFVVATINGKPPVHGVSG